MKRTLPQNQGANKKQRQAKGDGNQQSQQGYINKQNVRRQGYSPDKLRKQQSSPTRKYRIPKVKTPKTPRNTQQKSPKPGRKSPGNFRNQNF